MADTVSELLPCPFCGGEAKAYPIRGIMGFTVSCQNCQASAYESDPQRVVLHWNTRASTQPAPAFPREEVAQAARFLLDRLVDHEVRMTSDEDAREWHGHVTPAMARLRALLQGKQP